MRHLQPTSQPYEDLLKKAIQLKKGGYPIPPELFARLSGLAKRYQ